MWRKALMLLLNVSSCAQVMTKQGISASKSWKSEVGRRDPSANGDHFLREATDASETHAAGGAPGSRLVSVIAGQIDTKTEKEKKVVYL